MRATCPTYRIFRNLITLIIFGVNGGIYTRIQPLWIQWTFLSAFMEFAPIVMFTQTIIRT